jgi:hypothetical protein
MKDRILCRFSYQQLIAIALVGVVILVSAPFIPAGIDWSTVLRPATIAFLQLENPYQIEGTFSPPWLFLLLAPVAILPVHAGGVIVFWLNLATWIVLTNKLSSGNIASIVAVITSPMVVNGLLARNIDFLVMWGLLLPAEFAVLFLALKPQVGGAAILYLCLKAYQEGGLKKLIRLLALPILMTMLSFALYGLWPLNAGSAINLPWNASPIKILGWPSIIIGLFLFILALSRKNPEDGINISMASTPFFSPYVGSQSWVAILPSLIKTKALYIMWVVLWAWIAYRTFR